jgi:hypothetical protein
MNLEVKILAYLDGQVVNDVLGLDEIEIDTSFISDSRTSETAQPVININKLNFVGASAQKIISYQLGGLTGASNGILEMMPLKLVATNGTIAITIFDGGLNFKDYQQISPSEVSCAILETDSMNSANERFKSYYFNLAEEKGVYKQSDYIEVKYIIEKVDVAGEVASLSVTLFLLSMALIQQAEKVAKELGTFLAFIKTLPGGSIGAAAYKLAVFIADTTILVKLTIEIIDLCIKLVETVAPPVRRHKAIREHDLLRIAFADLGYTFETNILEMYDLAVLPSNPSLGNDITSGVPRIGQIGDNLADFIGIVLDKYDAQLTIINNVVHIRSVNDPFWKKTSTYILPDVGSDDVTAIDLQSEFVQFNQKDFTANTKISFARDVSEEYTIREFEGTNFMVIREPENVSNPKNLLFDGLDEINIPYSLGVRKTELSEIENILKDILETADTFIDVITIGFSNSNLAGLINDRIGALKLSQSIFTNPKFIYMERRNNVWEVHANQRNRFSAKVLYDKYHSRKSFVNTSPVISYVKTTDSANIYEDLGRKDYGNQKRLFENFPVPFGMNDYDKMKNNSYFSTVGGEEGKIEDSKWHIRENETVQNYWIKQLWTKNIKEVFIEAK